RVRAPEPYLALDADPVVERGRVPEREPLQEIAAVERRGHPEPVEQLRCRRRGRAARELERLVQPGDVDGDWGVARNPAGGAPSDQDRVGGVAQDAPQEDQRAAQAPPTVRLVALGPEQRGQRVARVRVALDRQVGQQRLCLTRRERDNLLAQAYTRRTEQL